jgi:hypothetical protein
MTERQEPTPAITDAVADAIADGDDGPLCGTAEAVTTIWVGYLLNGMTHIDRGRYCCARHVSIEAQHMPKGAELADVVIQDGLVQTTVRADGTATILVNCDYLVGDLESFPPTWPNSANAVELGDFEVIIP